MMLHQKEFSMEMLLQHGEIPASSGFNMELSWMAGQTGSDVAEAKTSTCVTRTNSQF
jgi:hypothetical protein